MDRRQDANAAMSETNMGPLVPTLLPEALSLLPSLQQDPEPLVRLIIKLLQPLSFTEALSYSLTPSSLAEALSSASSSISLLAVEVLSKAAESASDTAVVAGMRDVVAELVVAYLSHEIDVSSAIGRLIERFLTIDRKEGDGPGANVSMIGVDDDTGARARGQGLMWRRLFDDRDIYSKFFSLTSHGPSSEKRQRSLAQARLLALLPPLAALDFAAVMLPHFPDVESAFGLERGKEGLLQYAARHMIDYEEDDLLHMALIDFCTSLLLSVTPEQALRSSTFTAQHSSPALDFVTMTGIHSRIITSHLNSASPNSVLSKKTYLHGRSANYLATYAATYPEHILRAKVDDRDTYLIDVIDAHLRRVLQHSLASRASDAPSHDLHVMSSLPRVSLLPMLRDADCYDGLDGRNPHPMKVLHSYGAHEEYFKTLATLFHGPTDADRHSLASEAAAARVFFLLYTHRFPNLFSVLASTAGMVALREKALSALGTIAAIITARWAPLPADPPEDQARYVLPSEHQLRSLLHQPSQTRLPETGLEAVLQPPAVHEVIPYLCELPKAYSNLVGGRGDSESAAFRVATAKYDTLRKLHEGLKSCPNEYDSIKATVAQAVSRGPWSRQGNIGVSVGTMEL